MATSTSYTVGRTTEDTPIVMPVFPRRLALLVLILWASSEARRTSFVGSQIAVNSRRFEVVHQPRIIPSSLELAFHVRGGSSLENDVLDDDEEEEDDDEGSDLFNELDADSIDSGFTDDAMGNRLAKIWAKTPPMTQAYLLASAAAALLGMLFNNNQFPSFMMWNTKRTFTHLELWRPLTSFLNFGPLGLSFALTMQFLWVYMATLERLNHNRPYDFMIMLLFGMASMAIGYPILKMNPRFLGHNLSTYLVYIWSRYHEGVEVDLFGLLTVKAELLPWAFLAQTYLLEGEPPILDLLGIVFGHIYYHLKTAGRLQAPHALVNWYENSSGAAPLRDLYKPISADFDAA